MSTDTAGTTRRTINAPHGVVDRTERGWALVSVLWALTILALMAAATEALTVTSYRIEQRAILEARTQAALDAAIVRAVLGISDLRPSMRWRVDGAHRQFAFEGVSIDISVQDEFGHIDLNAASVALIVQLFTAAGVAPDEASVLADRISAWRSSTGLDTLKGGTDDDYRAAGLSYLPRHGPFQAVDELKLVLGMTPQLFAKIRPALTVYSKHAMFDPSIAPREALWAIYANDPGKIDAILRAREGDPNEVSGWGLARGTIGNLAPRGGHAFSIFASTKSGNRAWRRTAVVEITGDPARPYFVLAWQ